MVPGRWRLVGYSWWTESAITIRQYLRRNNYCPLQIWTENIFLIWNPGEYILNFRLSVQIGEEKSCDWEFSSCPIGYSIVTESYLLHEVNIKADAEDPAYVIIRKAQKKRKFYLDQVESYQCNAYVKSTQKLLAYPKNFLDRMCRLKNLWIHQLRFFIWVESVSHLSFKRPEKVRKNDFLKSGNPRTYSFNQASDLNVNFMKNLVEKLMGFLHGDLFRRFQAVPCFITISNWKKHLSRTIN